MFPTRITPSLVRRREVPDRFRGGEFVDAGGKVVGAHDGHQQFTIGQRRGLGVALGYPVYVVDINPATNRVTLGEKEALLKQGLIAHQLNLLSEALAGGGDVRCSAKIPLQPASRSRHVAQLTGRADELSVRFDEPQSAITPGQAVVLYDGDVVLGGGWIDNAE